MTKNEMLAYSEVDEILNLLEDEYKDKVPQKIKELFKEEKNKEYKPKINIEIPLTEQNLKRETLVLLAILNLNCWCKDENEKQKILDELSNNDKETQDFLDKYNPDNLFKTRLEEKQEIPHTEELSVVEYKKSNFLQKLLSKIVSLLKK